MLYQIGPLTLDTRPMEVGKARIKTVADFAEHALISSREDLEFSGPGADTISLSGQLLPFHIGGLSELEIAKSLCTSGDPQFVFRGDGRVGGWHQILGVEEDHSFISPVGVGFVVKYEIELRRIDDPGSSFGADLIGAIVSLFG